MLWSLFALLSCSVLNIACYHIQSSLFSHTIICHFLSTYIPARLENNSEDSASSWTGIVAPSVGQVLTQISM